MDLTALIETGGTNPLVLFVVALALGALHGLEPGHSKTMMAAYIIAVQGTVRDAVLLGLSAALSHSVIVWGLALAALSWGNALLGEELEPWFMLVSGLLVIGIGFWMIWRGLAAADAAGQGDGHEGGHGDGHGDGAGHSHGGHDHGGHDHTHGGHAHVGHTHDGHAHAHDGHANAHDGHAHTHDGHAHTHDGHAHTGHTHTHGGHPHNPIPDPIATDAHARAHAAEIRSRLASGRTSTWQTVLFGLSGGLIPCPAAITVFLLCLHLGQLSLGIVLVGAFSVGLAGTLVAVGVVAALGFGYLSQKSGAVDRVMAVAPYLSGLLVIGLGVLIAMGGANHLGIDLPVSHRH